jgi:glycosyltransferase involved in cell wall biosynthesis
MQPGSDKTVLVCLDGHFIRVNKQKVYCEPSTIPSFFQNYRAVWPNVKVLARMVEVDTPPANTPMVEDEGIEFITVPDFYGPSGFVKRLPLLRQVAKDAIQQANTVIMRVSGLLSNPLWRELRSANRPYGVEVINDPYDNMAPGSVNHPLRPILRIWWPYILRQQCYHAAAATYVTETALQNRYPGGPATYTSWFSDVTVASEAFVDMPRQFKTPPSPFKIVFIGSLSQLYKAPEVLIEAIGKCVQAGANVQLTIIGQGQYREQLEQQTQSLDIQDKVHFTGRIAAGDPVRALLDQADLFVLPSRQEGLPRAMVEAMARALPCIGSTVGGIPELLAADDLVPPADADALTQKIREVMADPARLEKMSAQNLKKANQYRLEILSERREAFYQKLNEITRAWFQAQPR